jgi:serine/threonine protein kinase
VVGSCDRFPRLPEVHWGELVIKRRLGAGSFGDVELMEWASRGLDVAVKRNGTSSADVASIDNERRLYELLKDNPHDNILPVYAICADAPGGVCLVMKYCAKGTVSDYLSGMGRSEVCVRLWPIYSCTCSGCVAAMASARLC